MAAIKLRGGATNAQPPIMNQEELKQNFQRKKIKKKREPEMSTKLNKNLSKSQVIIILILNFYFFLISAGTQTTKITCSSTLLKRKRSDSKIFPPNQNPYAKHSNNIKTQFVHPKGNKTLLCNKKRQIKKSKSWLSAKTQKSIRFTEPQTNIKSKKRKNKSCSSCETNDYADLE